MKKKLINLNILNSKNILITFIETNLIIFFFI